MALTLSIEEIIEQSKSPLLAIAPDWKRVRLGDIATIQNGAPFKSELFNKDGKGMPVIRIRDVGSDGTETFYSGDYDDAYIVREGDLLIGMDGDFNCARWKGPDALLNQRVCRIIPKTDKYERRLMDFALPGYLKAINDVTSSVTVKHLSSKTVADILLPLPPPPEQRRIVSAIETQLGRLDAAVARLHGAKARLKRYKQAVLKAAVEGRFTEEWRQKHPSKHTSEDLLRDIHAEHRAIWEQEQLETFSAKGKIPKDNAWKSKYHAPVLAEVEALPRLPDGWNWLRIGTIGFVTKLAGFEYTEYVKYDPDGDLAVIKAENASRDGFRRTEFSKVRSETVAHLTRSKLIPGDILIVFVGSIGNVARVPADQSYFLGPNIGMIRVESKYVDPAYLEYFLRSPIGNHLINSFAKAVTQPSLSMGSIRLIPFAVPPIEEQRRIVEALEIMLERQSEMESTLDAQLWQAGRLRQAVLKRAFEGRLV